MLDTLLQHRNRARFSYHRAFHRASFRQVRRFMHNRVNRPPSRHPRRFASIGLTHRCQCSCEFCATGAFRKKASDELTTAQAELLLERIASSGYVFDNISFIGGECLLRPDIFQLVRHAADLGLFVHISTNGLLLEPDMVDMLLDAGLNSVFVAHSLEAPADRQTRLRRDTALAGVANAVAQDLPCFLSVCVCKGDVLSGRLERALALGREVGAAGVRLMPVRRAGRWLHQGEDRVLERAEERRLRQLCRGGYAFLTDDCCREQGVRCPAVRGDQVYISPYGDIHPCHFFPYTFGNVREGSLDRALHTMWGHEMINQEGYTCLLHDQKYRARYIDSIDREARLPLAV